MYNNYNSIKVHPSGLSSTRARLWNGFDLTSNQPDYIRSSIEKLSRTIWESRNEYCYEGLIDSHLVLYSDWADHHLDAFFKSDFINKIDIHNFDWEATHDDRLIFDSELFVKLVWLCKVLVEDGNFTYTMGTHYSPVHNNFIIHPGGTRQHAVLLFPPPKLKVIHFDTGGNKSKMQGQQLTRIDNYIDFCQLNDYQIVFTPDHGTFIPHPLKGTQTIISNKMKNFNIIKENLHNFSFTSNLPLKELEKYNNPKSTRKCVVKYNYQNVDLSFNPLDRVRIIILIILQKEFKCENFEITWKKLI